MDDPQLLQELLGAVQFYEEQLASLEERVAGGDAEAEALQAEVQQALDATQSALNDLRGEGSDEVPSAKRRRVSATPAQTRAASGERSPEHTAERPAEQGDAAALHERSPSNAHRTTSFDAPDFHLLAEKHPALRPHVKFQRKSAPHGSAGAGLKGPDSSPSRVLIDFRSAEANRELTRALLMEDFGIAWDVPEGNLIPPVPNRAHYIQFLHKLVSLSAPTTGTVTATGIDIGTGANLIYPLLGAGMYRWSFVAVDVSPAAIQLAHRNARANAHVLGEGAVELRLVRPAKGMSDDSIQTEWDRPDRVASVAGLSNVQVLERGDSCISLADPTDACESTVLLPAVKPDESFVFSMCNPPFFESMDQASQNPSTDFQGTPGEMTVPGGELRFVAAMVRDSKLLGGRIHWYTTMVGKKATLKRIKSDLQKTGPSPVIRTTELTQGRTSRWVLAWSWSAPRAVQFQQLPRT